MSGLGIVVTWAGYVVFFYGYNLIHNYGLKFSDIATLPVGQNGQAKRDAAIAAIKKKAG